MEATAAQILAQRAPTEAPAAEAETVPEQSSNPSFDLIAKMERRLRQQEQEMKSKYGSYDQEKADLMAKLKRYEEDFGDFEQNPLNTLKRKGYDIEKINKLALETLDDDEMDPVAKRFKEMDARFEEINKSWEQKMQEAIAAKEKEYQERDNEYQKQFFKKDLSSFLTKNADKYEFINAEENGADLVYEVIIEDLQAKYARGETNAQVMSHEEAADLVEKHLDSQIQKYLQLNKVKSRHQEQKPDWEKALFSQPPRTLTNDAPPKSAINPKQLSEQERLQLATEAMRSGKWDHLKL